MKVKFTMGAYSKGKRQPSLQTRINKLTAWIASDQERARFDNDKDYLKWANEEIRYALLNIADLVYVDIE